MVLLSEHNLWCFFSNLSAQRDDALFFANIVHFGISYGKNYFFSNE